MSTESSRLLTVLMKELGEHANRDYTMPKGWYTIDQIRIELRIGHSRNASTRARDLERRGLLERMPFRSKAKTGQCHIGYIYRPIPPFKSILEASDNAFQALADKVPPGWVRIIDYAFTVRTSEVAVRTRVARAKLKARFFKTPRGIAGLHNNAHYKRSDLDRVCR